MPDALLETIACEKAVIRTRLGVMLGVPKEEKNGMLADMSHAGMAVKKI